MTTSCIHLRRRRYSTNGADICVKFNRSNTNRHTVNHLAKSVDSLEHFKWYFWINEKSIKNLLSKIFNQQKKYKNPHIHTLRQVKEDVFYIHIHIETFCKWVEKSSAQWSEHLTRHHGSIPGSGKNYLFLWKLFGTKRKTIIQSNTHESIE